MLLDILGLGLLCFHPGQLFQLIMNGGMVLSCPCHYQQLQELAMPHNSVLFGSVVIQMSHFRVPHRTLQVIFKGISHLFLS
jgi:hypothetical protein